MEKSICFFYHYVLMFIVLLSPSNSSFKQVVEDFASENVVYIELRTTPKVLYLLHLSF